ncbi:MAG TPA: FAD-dependent oxidoreductase, partial [Planctomycetota bacterium]|nr:FAD-dependent oxidoreductase [Planctomycetota bacterium]
AVTPDALRSAWLHIQASHVVGPEPKDGAAAPASSSPADVAEAILVHLGKLAAVLFDHAHGHHRPLSFRLPLAINFDDLVETIPGVAEGGIQGPIDSRRRRDGFALTDPRFNRAEAFAEIDYCLYCHDRDKDSCSTGLKKQGQVVKNPLGIDLNGCPLHEKISEAHSRAAHGDAIGALALIAVDNPMCPGTGHRICNDCMKSCIFQKQEPVNIPQIETRMLTDTLHLPWGFEIYSLLTRWNPLNRERPVALPYNGKNVLVVGLGPAGYTVAHHLLNEGFGVTGVDGLKIEPLPAAWVGPNARPIRDFNEMKEPLDSRVMSGFGGVSEYGITVRWDKNFLRVIYLNLARREKFAIFGGVRFGGTLTVEDAWDLGFDHIAMATGAGKPTLVDMKNNLIRGVRKASDFLMGLQLTGAARKDTLANLQIRLPAIVVGGGLTGVDTATELMAYYPVQVEKVLSRFETLTPELGEANLLEKFGWEDRRVLQEFLDHGRAFREERVRAAAAGEKPNFAALVQQFGGVKLIYRKALSDAPAYRLNHEEIIKALEEGIEIVDQQTPVEALPDQFGALTGVKFEKQEQTPDGKWKDTGQFVEYHCKSLLVAAGTSPNIIYELEHPGSFQLDKRGKFFQLFASNNGNGGPAAPADAKTPGAFFTSYADKNDRRITIFGDNHPKYAGNVVQAMASAKNGFRHIVEGFKPALAGLAPAAQPAREAAYAQHAARLKDELTAEVVSVNPLTPTIVEVVVRAPMAAKRFQPGQFFRLQDFEADAKKIDGTVLTMEGLALTGAWTDPAKGLLSMIILKLGASSRLCDYLKPGQKVVVMGPTGAPTEIPKGETVLLAGGGLGNAVLFSIGKAMRSAGNKVLYFAGYKRADDLFKRDEIEDATDQIIFSVDAGDPIAPRRPQDRCFVGNIVQAIQAYAQGRLNTELFKIADVDRIIAIGSDRMMAAVKAARKEVLKPYLKECHVAIGSINSPMQCMMKKVCAQCLQKHVDPVTGAELEPVFSCFNQDQKLDEVDFANLHERLKANAVQERLANLWFDHLLAKDKALATAAASHDRRQGDRRQAGRVG